jgi:hypothetical protein
VPQIAVPMTVVSTTVEKKSKVLKPAILSLQMHSVLLVQHVSLAPLVQKGNRKSVPVMAALGAVVCQEEVMEEE